MKKNYIKTKTDRAWFVAFYDIRPGNGAGLFLQPRSPQEVLEEMGMKST